MGEGLSPKPQALPKPYLSLTLIDGYGGGGGDDVDDDDVVIG